MLQTAGLILIAGPVIMAGFVAVLIAVNAPRVFLTIVLVSIAFLEWRPIVALNTVKELGFYLGSIRVAPIDVLAFVAIAATAWLLLRNPRRIRPNVPAALLTLCVFIAVVFAINGLGLQEAVVYWRYWIYALAFFWWAQAAFRRSPEFPSAPFVIGGLTAALLWFVEVLRNGIGSADINLIDAYGNTQSSRPVTASLALMGLVAIIAALGADWRWSPGRLICLATLVPFVLLAQHRSVWTAGLAAGVSAAALHWSKSRNKLTGVALSAIATVVVLEVVRTLLESVQQVALSATSTGTWNGRVTMWGESLSSVEGTGRIIVGQLLGALDPTSFEQAYPRGFSSHNMYIETFLRLGIVGVVLLVVLFLQAMRRSNKDVRLIVIPCMLAMLVYGITYDWPPWTWAILGLSFALQGRSSGRSGTGTRDTETPSSELASRARRRRPQEQSTYSRA